MTAIRCIDGPALLRFWREDVLGLSLRAAADRLGTAPATVWQWESGETRPRLDPFAIDRRFGARGALGGLLWAVGTVDGLPASTRWTRVFRRGSPATWIWVRPADPAHPPEVFGEWGVTWVRFSPRAAADGAIYWVPLSMPEQPLIVRLSTPGWVDFGQGAPPPRILDLPVIDASKSVERVPYPSQALGELARRTAGGVARRRLTDRATRRRLPDRFVATLLASEPGDQRPSWVEQVPESPLASHPPTGTVDRQAFRRLRLARNLSYRQLAARLADEFDTEVGADTIRRFETRSGQRTRLSDLDAALDLALDGGGRLAVRPVARSGQADRLDFPQSWRGPVWVALTGVRRPVVVRFRWGRWTKDIHIEADTVVGMHCLQPDEPLHITASDDVDWQAGIGHLAGSRPIDRNWSPVDGQAAREVQALALNRAATAFGLSKGWVRSLFTP